MKACCSGGSAAGWWCAEIEVEDGVGYSVFRHQGCFRHDGGGSVDGEVREWWSAAAMVMVGEEGN